MECELDAKKVVEKVKKKKDPSRWNTFHNVSTIRKRFLKTDWSLNCKGREANLVDDRTAKFDLIKNCLLVFMNLILIISHGC